jgi:hypothetical protein
MVVGMLKNFGRLKIQGEIVLEGLQSPFLTQSYWSNGPIVCFPPQEAAVRALGVQPTFTLELGIPVSTVSLH